MIQQSFLLLCSIIYRQIITLRHWFYDQGFFTPYQSALPTVSVGNITVGGSGKTPMVALLAQLLASECKVAVLSRGYKGKAEKKRNSLLVQDQLGGQLSVNEVGDEPYLLVKKNPQLPVFVGKKRKKSALLAKEKGYELLLLDDGMQHRALHRDMEVVMIEGRDPFGGGFFLPRGRLRELPARLTHADLVIINGPLQEKDRNAICSYTSAPIVQGEMRITVARTVQGEKVALEGKKIAVFCAIGSPYRFLELLASYGSSVVATYFLQDHKPFTLNQLRKFLKEAQEKGATYLCCTEKDGVKLPCLQELSNQVVIVEGEFVIQENEKSFKEMVLRMKSLAKEKR